MKSLRPSAALGPLTALLPAAAVASCAPPSPGPLEGEALATAALGCASVLLQLEHEGRVTAPSALIFPWRIERVISASPSPVYACSAHSGGKPITVVAEVRCADLEDAACARLVELKDPLQ